MPHSSQPTPLAARRSPRSSGGLAGTAAVPGDKSISHRALILGALTVGETRISGLLEGEDVLATAEAMRAFGAGVTRTSTNNDADNDASNDGGAWTIHGVGVGGLAEPEGVIDCGNAGTAVRLIMGMMATTPISATFTGDASLRRRPMGRILDPLTLFGARSAGRAGGLLPLTLTGASSPVPVAYTLPVASAQVKSAVLLAGLNAPGETVVIEPAATRDHTERMLRGFGAEVTVEELPEKSGGGRAIRLTGQPELAPMHIAIPRDPSSAAFPVAAALIAEGSEIVVPEICLNPTRAGFYRTLIEMGADLVYENPRETCGEPVADLRARFSAMKGIEVPPERAASMIDEYPVLAVIAACAEGDTVMRGIGELRVKESDRIAATVAGLRANGIEVTEEPDGMIVHGRGPVDGRGGVPGGATVATHLDHRIAMAFLVLGLASRSPVTIDDAAPIATSFPSFIAMMQSLGAEIG